MRDIFRIALSNVRNDPAAYTIMILVLAASLFALTTFDENPSLRLASYGISLIAVIIMLKFALSKSGRSDDGRDSFLKCSNLPFLDSFRNTCKNLEEKISKDHPLLHMFGGFLNRITDEISKDSISLAPEYYFSCFAPIGKLENPNIFAIADLVEDVEGWDSSKNILWQGVNERIFHINWKDLYENKLDDLLQSLNQDAHEIERASCNIRLITTRETDELVRTHPFDDLEHLGEHLLIIKKALIGTYLGSQNGERLHLKVANDLDIDRAEKFYQTLKKVSIPIEPFSTAKSVRSKWIKANDIGLWDPGWNGKQERGKRYVDDYDRHIYCWIPDYQDLVEQCFNVSIRELGRRCRNTPDGINILELGCGTGALTIQISDWAANLNKLLDKPISRYTIIDQSKEMLDKVQCQMDEEVKSRLADVLRFERRKVIHGDFARANTRYDVIIGSLFFHFLIGKEWDKERIIRVVNHITEEWLNPGGCMIWADVFFTDDQRCEEYKHWMNHMKNFGMSEESIDIFLNNNKDMVDAPSYDTLRDSLSAEGYELSFFSSATTHSNPFNTVKIKKC